MRNVTKLLLKGAIAISLLSATAAHAAPERVRHVAVCPAISEAHMARCHSRVVVDEAGNLRESKTPGGYGPTDLRSAYKITGSGSSSTIIAIVDAFGYPNAESDLATYRAQYGLPACTTANGCFQKLNQTGSAGPYPKTNKGWSQEAALDLDMASAMCPSCKIILVEANSNSSAALAASVDTAAAFGAHVISNSYGGSESGSSSYEGSYNHPGIAITVSTGDSGYGVQFPASSPHVTAVGGTHLVTAANSRGWTETAWSGAGSGCSTVYSKPSWQLDSGCAMRSLADVSAVADPNTGVAVYGPVTNKRSGWLVFGGTSVAAPVIAGVYGVNGGPVNYGADPYANLGALFDVTSGSNGSCAVPYLCNAVVGYDGPTGLGTPNGSSAF
jgi:subtilase family serine protease